MERNVRAPPLRAPEHARARNAIEFASEFDRAHRQQDEHLVLGKCITWIDWSEGALAFGVEGGASICLRLDSGTVTHQIQSDCYQPHEAQCASEPMVLCFSPALRAAWDRSALAATLVGETLKGIFVTPDRLLLYVSQSPQTRIVAASVLIDADSGSSFLYWDFSE